MEKSSGSRIRMSANIAITMAMRMGIVKKLVILFIKIKVI